MIIFFFDFFSIFVFSSKDAIIALSFDSVLLLFSPFINSSILISSSLHNFLNKDTSGKESPLSHLLTAFVLIPSFSANASCVKKYSEVDEKVKGLPYIPDEYKPLISIVNNKPLIAKENEIEENSRSKSAKLRIIERI